MSYTVLSFFFADSTQLFYLVIAQTGHSLKQISQVTQQTNRWHTLYYLSFMARHAFYSQNLPVCVNVLLRKQSCPYIYILHYSLVRAQAWGELIWFWQIWSRFSFKFVIFTLSKIRFQQQNFNDRIWGTHRDMKTQVPLHLKKNIRKKQLWPSLDEWVVQCRQVGFLFSGSNPGIVQE